MISLEGAPAGLTLPLLALAICLACRTTHDSESSPAEPSIPVRLNENNGSVILGEWAIESVDEADEYGAGHFVGTFRQDRTGHLVAKHSRQSVRHRIDA